MGTYFSNETLDALWARLVNATNEITGTTVSNAGIKGIHDALLSHFNLSHENTPITPGDYMKGIAVAARYAVYDTIEPTLLWSLEQIVDALEAASSGPTYSCSLSTNMILTLDQSGYETGFYLYNADTDEILCSHAADHATTYDLKDYYTGFENGARYYAVGCWWDEDWNEYNATSNTVTYASSHTVILLEDGIASSDIGSDPDWALYNADTNELIYTEYAALSPVDFSSHMTNGNSYYVEVEGVRSNTITYSGGESGYTCTLSQEGVLTLNGSASEYGYALYENGIQIAYNSADIYSSWDLSSYMTSGNKYYAEGSWANYINEDFDMEYYYAISNTIVYDSSGTTEYSIALDSALNLTISPSSPNTSSDIVLSLYNSSDEIICSPYGADGAFPFNFAQWAANNGIAIPSDSYYAKASFDDLDTDTSYSLTSNTIDYEGWNPGYTCTLSKDGVLTLSNSAYETGYSLYDANTGDEVTSLSADDKIGWDLSSHMTNGKQYYAIGRWWNNVFEEYNAKSNTVEYLGSSGDNSGGSDNSYITTTLTSTTLTDDIQFTISHTYDDSGNYIEFYYITLEDDTDGQVVYQGTIPSGGPDIGATFYASDIYSNYVYDSYYRLTVQTVYNMPEGNYWSSDSAYFQWPFEENDNEETTLDYSAMPNASMTGDGYIYVSNYSTKEYNGSEAIVYSTWYDVDGGTSTEQDWGYLSYGYVMLSDGVYFEGEPYMSEASYSIIIRDPNDETNSTSEATVSKP